MLLLLLVWPIGCRPKAETVSVQGGISYRGEALNGSVITFFPSAGRSFGASAPRGQYTIELPPGEYTVVIEAGNEFPPGFKEGDPLPPPRIVLPEQYTTRAKSELKATIEPGQSQPLDFDMK